VTPLKIQLKPGKHRIYVKKNRYSTKYKTLNLNKVDKKKAIYFKLSKADTNTKKPVTIPLSKDKYSAISHDTSNTAQLGKLRIDSRPRGASVKVNGVARGVTPIVVSNLQKNTSLSISVSKKGYRNWSRSLKLTRDWTELNASLTR